MQLISLEAENLFIGCLLKDGTLINDTNLQPQHLYDPENKDILKVIRKLNDDNETIDLVSVVIKSKGSVNKNRLADLINSVPSVHSFKMTEKRILESYKLREVKRIQSMEISDVSEIETLKEELDKLTMNDVDDEYDHRQAMIELYDSIENQSKGLSGYDTGFTDLNRFLDGFQETDLIISAARPSTGKTAKMLAHAYKHCSKGHITAIFSLEMSERLLNQRMISQIGKINGSKCVTLNNILITMIGVSYHSL